MKEQKTIVQQGVKTMEYMKSSETENRSCEVTNVRQEDCPEVVEKLSTGLGILFTVSLVPLLISLISNMWGSNAKDNRPIDPAYVIVAGVFLALFVAACGLKSWYQRRAWIWRMQAQEVETRPE